MKKMLLGVLMVTSIGAFAQTKKVIIEDYTGLKCGWCPEGTVILEGLHAANPTTCIDIAMHGGGYEPASSPLKNNDAEAVITFVSPSGYPAGAVDRKKFSGETRVAVGRGKWSSYFNNQKATTAKVSVSFDKMTYDATTKEYTADVNVEFSEAPTASDVRIQVYAIEDSIPATGNLAQDNYSSNVQGGASPLNPWWHNRTFRKAIAGTWGSQIQGTITTGKVYTYEMKFTMPSGYVAKNVHFVAFVAKNETLDREIYNAEEVPAAAFFPTSVNNVKQSVSVASVYPNPSSVNDIVNIQYSIDRTSDVTMKVYNLVGQLVAQPYNSHEVKGTHIINWNPSNNNLTPGIYVVEVSTPEGKHVQRVNLY